MPVSYTHLEDALEHAFEFLEYFTVESAGMGQGMLNAVSYTHLYGGQVHSTAFLCNSVFSLMKLCRLSRVCAKSA